MTSTRRTPCWQRSLLAGAGLAALAGCATAVPLPAAATSGSRPSPSASQRYPLGLTTYPVGTRGAAPVVSGTTWQGAHVDVASLRGQVVVVNVWASWCEPCRQESRVLATLARVRSSRVRFVGVDESDTAAAVAAFVKSSGSGYPQVRDDGSILRGTAAWLPSALPGTLVLDRQGRVAARVVGAVSQGQLDPVLDRLSRG